MDVLDVLDGRGEPDFGDDKDVEGGARGKNAQGGEATEDDEDDEDEDEDDEDDKGQDNACDEEMTDALAPSDTEQQPDEGALDQLGAFLSRLEPGKKRKADDASKDVNGDAPPPQKRRMLKERTEAGVEGEFGVHAASGLFQPCNVFITLMPHCRLQAAARRPPRAAVIDFSLAAGPQKVDEAPREGCRTCRTAPAAHSGPPGQRSGVRTDQGGSRQVESDHEADKGGRWITCPTWCHTSFDLQAEHLSFPLQVPQKVHPSNSELTAKFKASARRPDAARVC